MKHPQYQTTLSSPLVQPRRNVLVTGAAGFIGANFVDYWLKHYPYDDVIGLDKLTYAANLNHLSSAMATDRFSFVRGDIGDFDLVEGVMREHQINWVVNFAAESHVDRSIANPDDFVSTNILGTHNLLKVCKLLWIDEQVEVPSESDSTDYLNEKTEHPVDIMRRRNRHFHQVSTDEVYGSLTLDMKGFTESSQFAPNSPYSASKAAADHLVRAYHQTYGLSVTTSHCSNNYGPYHHHEKLIPMVITRLLNNQTVGIYGDGLQVRDWLYVEDHVRGLELVIQHGQIGEHFNIGSNNELTNLELVTSICNLLEQKFDSSDKLRNRYPSATAIQTKSSHELVRHIDDRLGHDRRYALDCHKLEAMGYQTRTDFGQGLSNTIDWFLENLQ